MAKLSQAEIQEQNKRARLAVLPRELICEIAAYLQPQDYYAFSQCCREIYSLTQNYACARIAVQAHIPHTLDAKLADQKQISFYDAIRRTVFRMNAMDTGRLYFVGQIDDIIGFRMKDGVLCYQDTSGIGVMDISRGHVEHLPLETGPCQYELLHYSSGFISYLSFSESCSLLALNIINIHSNTSWVKTLPSTQRPTFVRNDRTLLVYGYRLEAAGTKEWYIQAIRLDTGKIIPEMPVRLHNFLSFDIGKDVCFEVQDGCLHAVSIGMLPGSQASWYTYLVLPASGKVSPRWTIYRRPPMVNELYSDSLRLMADCVTGKLLIVENCHTQQDYVHWSNKHYLQQLGREDEDGFWREGFPESDMLLQEDGLWATLQPKSSILDSGNWTAWLQEFGTLDSMFVEFSDCEEFDFYLSIKTRRGNTIYWQPKGVIAEIESPERLYVDDRNCVLLTDKRRLVVLSFDPASPGLKRWCAKVISYW
ncbi:hypothetical protein D8B26_005389 [Coccidioides posadasii str. Silveira]|uniref:Uncharacterized protein n=1 Tax=Coccidioides posadasii (strain RMSCC 757 / Silveira) TaxID=443226 RepID=E9D565_COCPS|nr:hypothetical protein CPSG_05333 [Coccidioides posadasii str. Silveira]QVM10736.1 hypothetical protein D8B26_005389 [Coccidioides posadasii str. Silveira]